MDETGREEMERDQFRRKRLLPVSTEIKLQEHTHTHAPVSALCGVCVCVSRPSESVCVCVFLCVAYLFPEQRFSTMKLKCDSVSRSGKRGNLHNEFT